MDIWGKIGMEMNFFHCHTPHIIIHSFAVKLIKHNALLDTTPLKTETDPYSTVGNVTVSLVPLICIFEIEWMSYVCTFVGFSHVKLFYFPFIVISCGLKNRCFF